MARFMTRIELHGNPTAENYAKLHEAMERQGFGRTIASGDGSHYHLPTAEYYGEFNLTLQQVLDRAKTAAASVWTKFSAVSSETVSSSWSGLARA